MLYEYVFFQGVTQPFSIFKMLPRNKISPDLEMSLTDLNIEFSTLTVEIDDNGVDPVSYLLGSKVSIILIFRCFYWILSPCLIFCLKLKIYQIPERIY